MPEPDIRLRLAIRRHGLPEMKLLWPCPRSSEVTVAKLLTSVNSVVPLESSTWGLEDYVVELADSQGGSFECLHFQQVANIFKDDDHVIIRSLLTDDLKRRRLSGRHQISIDGKHLVDGVAFGRPWLRAPRDRPAIELPPRKRARIAYETQPTEVPTEQLMLEGPAASSDGDPLVGQNESGNDSDVDFSCSDDDASDSTSNKMSADWHNDESVCAPGELELELEELAKELVENQAALSKSKDSVQQHVAAIRTAFPSVPRATIADELQRRKNDLRKTYDALKRSRRSALTYDEMMEAALLGDLDLASSLQQGADDVTLLSRPRQKPLIQEISSESRSESSDVGSDNSESMSPQQSCDSSGVSNEDDSNSNKSDSTSSDDSDDDSDDSEDESEDESEDDGEDESEDDSEDDSEDVVEDGVEDDSEDDSEDESEVDSSEESDESSPAVSRQEFRQPLAAKIVTEVMNANLPGQGLTKTQKRNMRRRKHKALNKETSSIPSARDADLLARKEALIEALSEKTSTTVASNSPDAVDADSTKPTETRDETPSSAGSEAPRRARIDLGAGRRMLFAALGLKNPKSKADEEKLRQNFQTRTKPSSQKCVAAAHDAPQEHGKDDEGNDSWRSKISYRAIECCHEGMILSEPPFPFVQRWDPQQQYSSMRKRKRDYDAEYEESYLEGVAIDTKLSSEDLAQRIDAIAPVERSEGNKKVNVNGFAGTEQNREDLIQLPQDLESLAPLHKHTVKEGMVITWKQCVMSKATQWQPVLASVTAVVLPGSTESGLEVQLAFRDRQQQIKVYDEVTGQRIYDKFETPDADEDEVEDDGRRFVTWDDMMEPRIVTAVTNSAL